MNNIYLLIPDKKKETPLALATVIETRGSTPQKHGSSALFSPDGLVAGTIGGGVLEGRVQLIAQQVIKTNKSGIHHFSFDNDISLKEEAICGGKASVLIDATPGLHNELFEEIKNSVSNGISGVLITIVREADESNIAIERYWFTSGGKINIPVKNPELFTLEAEKMLAAGKQYGFKKIDLVDEVEKNFVLLEPVFTNCRLIIAGAGHIGKSLAHFGKLLDFDVTVIDDRAEYANSINIPDADSLIVEDIGEALGKIRKDSTTFIVIVTRGHNDDAKALRSCINSGAGYIGMIGSKNKIAQMHRDFVKNGWAIEAQWEAIHAPVGLEIFSQTVEEIAVSIAAELVLVRNRKR